MFVFALGAPVVATAQEASRVNPTDKAEMVRIPTGPFVMGSDEGPVEQRPAHQVTLKEYWIYRHEVTVGQYLAFVEATDARKPSEPRWGWTPTHPIVGVSAIEAAAYCRWAGVRLPSEAEWEKAARGTDGRRFPWGDKWIAGRARAAGNHRAPHPVGSIPEGASPYGVMDLIGNAAEWVNDRFQADYYANSPANDPTGPDRAAGSKVVRGGAFDVGNLTALTATARSRTADSQAATGTGFRCAAGG
jgi:sulfatase modifying factor 1